MQDVCVLLLLLLTGCVVPDGLSAVGRGGTGPPAETDHRGRLSGVPGRALLRQAGALR